MLTFTEKATKQLKALLDIKNKKAMRISIQTKGCSGLAYKLEFADEKGPFDETIFIDSYSVFIDPKAQMFIVGTQVDFESNELRSGFIFENPLEKGRCGCGKSFHV